MAYDKDISVSIKVSIAVNNDKTKESTARSMRFNVVGSPKEAEVIVEKLRSEVKALNAANSPKTLLGDNE